MELLARRKAGRTAGPADAARGARSAGVRGSLANIFVNLAFCGQKYFPPNGKGKNFF